MRISEILYFSPKYKYSELDWDNKENLIEAFIDRVEGYYIQPTELLNEDKKGFATGVLCITTIDFLAKFLYTGANRMIKWLKKNIKAFNKLDPNLTSRTLADRFYDEFRNRLIHEGRIKNAGQFSYDFPDIIKVEKNVMIVNPNILLNDLMTILENFINRIKVSESEFLKFKESLIRDFTQEINYVKNDNVSH